MMAAFGMSAWSPTTGWLAPSTLPRQARCVA